MFSLFGGDDDDDDRPPANRSIRWVEIMLAIAVLAFGWGFLAAAYDSSGIQLAGRGRVGGKIAQVSFFANALHYLPRFSEVMADSLQHRLWMIITIAVAFVGVFVLGAIMKKLDRELYESPRSRRR